MKMKKFQKWNNLDVDKYVQSLDAHMQEAIDPSKMKRAVTLVSNLISRRIGDKIYVSTLPEQVTKAGGEKLEGMYGVFGEKQLRYNWKISGSAEIHSVDIWNKIKPNPDITVSLNGVPLVKCVDIIAQSIIQGKPVGEQVLEESVISSVQEKVSPRSGGKVSQNIADAIRQWAIDMDIDDNRDLEKRRLKELFETSFEYWRLEVANTEYKKVSFSSFRNYLIAYMQKNGLRNVFMKVVASTKAKGETVITDKKQKDSFDKAIYSMSLEDQFEFAEMAIMSILKGYQVAQGIFSSVGGVGKTTLVNDILKKNGKGKFKKVSIIKGGIAKPIDLYKKIFKDKKDTLFIMDDVESVLKKSADWQDLAKSLFDDQKERLISYYDDPKKLGKGVPTEFYTNAGFIVLSNINKDKLPSALQRRLSPIQIEGSKQEIIDRIRVNLDNVFPEVDYAIKDEVLSFIEGHIKDIRQIEFSSFQKACIFRLAEGNPSWKKQILFMLRRV